MTTLESDDRFSVVKTNRLYIGSETVTEIQSDATGLLFDKPLSVTNYLQLNNVTDSNVIPSEAGKLTLYSKNNKLSYKTTTEDLAFGTPVGNIGDVQFNGTDGFDADSTFNFDTTTKTLTVQSLASPEFNTPLSINYLDANSTIQTAMSIQGGNITFGNVTVDVSDSVITDVDRIEIAPNTTVSTLDAVPTIQSYSYVDGANVRTNNVMIKPGTQGDLVVITSPSDGIYNQSLRVRDTGGTNFKRQVIQRTGDSSVHPYYGQESNRYLLSKEESGAVCLGSSSIAYIVPLLTSDSDEGLHYTFKTDGQTEIVFRNTVVWPELGQTSLTTSTLTNTQLQYIYNTNDGYWIDFIAIKVGAEYQWQVMLQPLDPVANNGVWWTGVGPLPNNIPDTSIAVSEPVGELAWLRNDGGNATATGTVISATSNTVTTDYTTNTTFDKHVIKVNNQVFGITQFIPGTGTFTINGTWISAPSNPQTFEVYDPMYRANASVTTDDVDIYHFGGSVNGTLTNDVIVYNDTTTSVLNHAGASVSARQDSTMVLIGTSLWIFGGYDGGSYLNDVYEGVITGGVITWTQKLSNGGGSYTPVVKMPARSQANGFYDPTANKVVIFGGYDGSINYADAWVYDIGSDGWFYGASTIMPNFAPDSTTPTNVALAEIGTATATHATTTFTVNTVTLVGDANPDGFYVGWHLGVGGEYIKIVSYVGTVATLERTMFSVPATNTVVSLFEYISVGSVYKGCWTYNPMDRIGYLVGGNGLSGVRASTWRLDWDGSRYLWSVVNYMPQDTKSDFSEVLGGVAEGVTWSKFGVLWVMAFDRVGLNGQGRSNDLWSYGSKWEYKDGSINAYTVTQFSASDTYNIVEGVEPVDGVASHDNYPPHATGYQSVVSDSKLYLAGGVGYGLDSSPVFRSSIQDLGDVWVAPV